MKTLRGARIFHELKFTVGLFALVAGLPSFACAEDFAVAVSPPRFELSAKPGSVIRQVLEISNAAPSAASYGMKTADWTLETGGGAKFSDDLQPGSCRPWVAVERHDITVLGHGSYRFRFEVAPPATAQRGECRFAIMLDGQEKTVKTGSGLNIPVAGRVGVIVYVAVGEAQPRISIVGAGVAKVNGELTPVLQVRNEGDAHGRLDGFLSGVDGRGKKIDLAPSTLPILPGETRTIPLVIDQPDNGPPIRIAYPITIRGKITWDGGSTNLSQPFDP